MGIILADQLLKFYIKLNFIPGQEVSVLGDWFRLHFVENEGMAWGWKFGGDIGKIILTLFRLGAVIWGVFFIKGLLKKNYSKGLLVCTGLIFAGAVGNLIDSLFYGLVFNVSYNPETYEHSHEIAKAFSGGYAPLFHGKVVDMLYFPLIDTHWPTWIPFFGGSKLEFFQPVFNIADSSISLGVFILLLFQNKFLKKKDAEQTTVAA